MVFIVFRAHYMVFLWFQEVAEVHTGPDASVWSPLHALHGYSIHRRLWPPLAGPDALRDVF